MEFATEVEHTKFPTGKKMLGKEVRRDAQTLKGIIRFPGFDQIQLDDPHWKEINPVQVFGGLGKTEFIIVRDDGGNFNLKSAAFDPAQTAAVLANSAMSVMRIIATVHGIPAGGAPADQERGDTSIGSLAALTSRLREGRELVRLLDSIALQLREQFTGIQDGLPADEPIEGTKLEGIISAIRRTITGYRGTLGVASQGAKNLESLGQRADP